MRKGPHEKQGVFEGSVSKNFLTNVRNKGVVFSPTTINMTHKSLAPRRIELAIINRPPLRITVGL